MTPPVPPIAPRVDPAHDVLGHPWSALDPIFSPRTVAVVGATEAPGSVGRTVLRNLVTNPFGGTVFPVNPRRASVLGIKAYPSVAAVPDRVDLAVVATPAPSVPEVIRQCADSG
jgi:acetyltransferase